MPQETASRSHWPGRSDPWQVWGQIRKAAPSDLVETADATVTTLVSIPIKGTILVQALVLGHRTSGLAGAADDSAVYRIFAGARVSGGGAALIGLPVIDAREDQVAWDATVVISGSTLLIRVTGAVDNNINWRAVCQVETVA